MAPWRARRAYRFRMPRRSCAYPHRADRLGRSDPFPRRARRPGGAQILARRACSITYHVGGDGPRGAHLAIQANWDLMPVYDVIAVMKGVTQPDEWVVRGNHRDGWVFGAQDPLAGQTALMEEAKSLGALARTGWRPARTLVYASWDGEEPALLGSTEWAETHAQELQSKAVVYINSDTNDRGFLFVEASYSLRSLVDQAAADVIDPETSLVSVRDRALLARLQVEASAPGARAGAQGPGHRNRAESRAARGGPRIRLRLHAVRPTPGHRVDQSGIVGGEGQSKRRLSLSVRYLRALHSVWRSRDSSTAWFWRKPPAGWCCALLTPSFCRSGSTTWARRSPRRSGN